MEKDEIVQIILGRPFLATARAVIDVHRGKLSLRVQSETVTFNIRKSMKSKHSCDDYLYCTDHTAKMIQEQWVDTVSHDRKWAEEEEKEDSINVHAVSFYPRIEPIEPLKCQAPKNRLKPSSIEPPKLELKELPEHLEYAFLQENNQLPVVISSALSTAEKARLLEVLKNHKGAIAWSIADIKGIDSSFCTHKILMEDEFKPSVQPQRRVNPNIKESLGESCPGCPKKGGMTIVKNEKDELIPQRTVTGWRMCIDNRKLNNVTQKDHFPLPFIDQMLERLAGHEYYCFLDGFLGYFQILIAPEDQEKTTFTCPYGTFAYKRMPFGLCNVPATFQRCIIAIFHELVEDCMEVQELRSTKQKIKAISKLPYPTNLRSIRSFLGHVSFYRRFIKDFSQIARPMTQLLVKDTPFNFSAECIQAFDKFRQYLVFSKTVVFMDHSAIRYLFTKQDVTPRLIRWILLLQEFDIEIRDKKGAKNLAADHLSRLENPDLGKLTKAKIRDLFLKERLMAISNKNNEPWYADYASYLASRVLPFRSTHQEKQRILQQFDALLLG
ncbi:reverse transcriptase domain-containing protein [Tanacetum coccineum]